MEEQKPEEEKKGEAKEAVKPAEEKKEEAKPEESKGETPPPPPEILLRVFMHCEGCARKVRRSLKGFEGVEDVITDCRTQKVIVKGEKADPLKVLERVQRKSHRQVELLSPIPKPPAAEEKPPEEEKPKPEEKKEEPPITLVVLKVYMHCEACAQEMKKRILRMKGVESAEPDLKSSEVSVKGVFDPATLVKYVYKRTGKHAVIVKQEVEKKEAAEGKGSPEEKKDEGSDGDKKAGGGEGGDGAGGASGEKKEVESGEEAKPAAASDEMKLAEMEMMKHEFLYPYYPSRVGYYSYPQPQQFVYPRYYNYAPVPPAPQMFSDENPNACSVM